MIAPPATVERLLEALGTKTDFRDGILGDLAEEFALRAERDGAAAARRWYYRESIRASPHLLRDWARGLRAPDVRHLADVVIPSFVFAETLLFFVELTVVSVTKALGLSLVVFGPPGGPIVRVVGLTLLAMGAIMGGWIAAWFDERTPLINALALGMAWSCGIIVMSAIVGTREPIWYPVCATAMVVAGTTIGGILRVRAT
jgi:hypothetical protein